MVVERSSGQPRVGDFLGFYKIILHQGVTTLPIKDISTQTTTLFQSSPTHIKKFRPGHKYDEISKNYKL